MNLQSENGQLLLPMFALLFLFSIFLATYIVWAHKVYWKMKMDTAADMTALSAARTEAQILNTIATCQWLENGVLQKGRINGTDGGIVEAYAMSDFKEWNNLLSAQAFLYKSRVLFVAKTVATANGASGAPIPISIPTHHLKPQRVHIFFVHIAVPFAEEDNPSAYFARDWWPLRDHPQPIHRNTWIVAGHGETGKGKAQLWLDVSDDSWLHNGGFPSEQAGFLKGLGIQSFFPQFNARLMGKN